MQIKRITKTDKKGKRLFIEIGKRLKNSEHLPELKKGDEVAILPRRKLSMKQMEALLGKYVKYFDMSEEDGYSLCFEGVIKPNKPEFWGEGEEHAAKLKYALIDPEIGPIDSFNNLDDVFDLQVLPGMERLVNKVDCYHCKKQFFEAYKHCPHCGKFNRLYQKEGKHGKMVQGQERIP